MAENAGRDKEKAATYVELAKMAQESFFHRRVYEWQIALALWAGIGALTYFLITNKDKFPKVTLVFLFLFYLAFVLIWFICWLVPLRRANETDKRFKHYYMWQAEGTSEAVEKAPQHPLPPALEKLPEWLVWLAWWRKLRLMPAVNNVSDIPTVGKHLIIVAAVHDVLHFRVFDGDGKVAVDADEKKLTGQAWQIEDLKKQLVDLWPPHVLNRGEKERTINAVASIVGHTVTVWTYGQFMVTVLLLIASFFLTLVALWSPSTDPPPKGAPNSVSQSSGMIPNREPSSPLKGAVPSSVPDGSIPAADASASSEPAPNSPGTPD